MKKIIITKIAVGSIASAAGCTGLAGCGKSTLAKIIVGYERVDASEILLDGRPVQEKCFSPVQMIYQNPEFAVNPRIKAGESLKEPWDPD